MLVLVYSYVNDNAKVMQNVIYQNVFLKIMSTDIKLSKTLLSKIIKSGGFTGNRIGKLAEKTLKML